LWCVARSFATACLCKHTDSNEHSAIQKPNPKGPQLGCPRFSASPQPAALLFPFFLPFFGFEAWQQMLSIAACDDRTKVLFTFCFVNKGKLNIHKK